jgi:ABC-2 type transport system permease protein
VLMSSLQYPFLRFWSMLKKESIIIRRDFITYAFLIIVPFSEVVLFGYIMNTDPKNLPTIVVAHDSSPFVNNLIYGFKNTGYYNIKDIIKDDQEAERLMHEGKAQFIITIPPDFTHNLLRNNHPHILIEGDATDPIAIGGAFSAAKAMTENILNRDLKGNLANLINKPNNIIIDTHAKYNPAVISQYHTLPGLLATILSLSLIMLTAISITSEYEYGTLEMLLTTPVKPIEVILGKIIPNIVLGYILFLLTLATSVYLFHVPFYGSLLLLCAATFPYLICNLGIGIAVSTLSRTQFRAANIANTYILPAILLSGFMFPFYAMPIWAQWIGNILPPTHYLRLTSNIMLKDAGFIAIWPDLWPILLFTIVIVSFSLKYYRRTLD